MNPAHRYIQDVLALVFAIPEDRDRLAADLQAHFAEAEASGESAVSVIERMGPPAEVAAAFHAERPMNYAGFFERLLAFLGDMGFLSILSLPFIAFLLGMIHTLEQVGGDLPETLGFLSIVVFALSIAAAWILYFPLVEARYGKTLGKHVMGLRVLREDGTPIGVGQAFLRRLSFYFEMLVIDALFIPFTAKKQRALDVLTKTVVAREPGREATPLSWLLCLMLLATGVGSTVLLAVGAAALGG